MSTCQADKNTYMHNYCTCAIQINIRFTSFICTFIWHVCRLQRKRCTLICSYFYFEGLELKITVTIPVNHNAFPRPAGPFVIVCDIQSIIAHDCWVVLLVNSLRVVTINNNQHMLNTVLFWIIRVTETISSICSLIFDICSVRTLYSTPHSHSHSIKICSSLCRGFRVIRVVYF